MFTKNLCHFFNFFRKSHMVPVISTFLSMVCLQNRCFRAKKLATPIKYSSYAVWPSAPPMWYLSTTFLSQIRTLPICLTGPVKTFDASNRQVRVRKAVPGGTNLLGLKQTDLAVNEKVVPAALPAPPSSIIVYG